jgi:CRISPR-associated protein Csb1
MFEMLNGVPRLLLEQKLQPVQGDRFQPTGFADLGPAVYERSDGKRMLLVESAQSVANRLESVCLDGSGPEIAKELVGLAYIRVRFSGENDSVTTSLVEAHRINSPFIISDVEFRDQFTSKAEYSKGKPLDWKKIAQAVFFYDPSALLHGVFMANLEDGRIKLPRAVSGFIEAAGVKEAASGGVKNNPLDPTGKLRAAGFDENVYSNVPYSRTEYTAADVRAYFNLDLALLSGYDLQEPARELLIALALYKIRKFLRAGLRLRTACDFSPEGALQVTAPASFAVPQEETLLKAVQEKIQACTAANLFASPPVTQLTTKVFWKKEQGSTATTASPASEG